MNYMLAFTGAILDSRRDGVQVHASHFSRPPSLTVAEGGLYSRLFFFLRTAKTNFLVACVAAVACLRTGLVLSLHVPPELFGSGLMSWSRPLDEAKLPRRMVQV